MLDFLWAFMIIAGVVFGGVQGSYVINLVASGAIDSAKEAVELCIVMLGVVGLWNGIMNIAKEAGLISKWTKGINPAISFLFPKIPKDDGVRQDIAMNMIANMLGLGWAATPAGLRAMKGLARLQDERLQEKRLLEKSEENYKENSNESYKENGNGHKRNKGEDRDKDNRSINKNDSSRDKKFRMASDEMCTLIVLNISSLQLIPVNIIAYRSQYGSANPTAVIGPGLVATSVATFVAIIFCKCMSKR